MKKLTNMKKLILSTLLLIGVCYSYAQTTDWKTIVGVGAGVDNAVGASLSHGMLIDEHFFAGVGCSIGMSDGVWYAPALFFQTRINFGGGKVCPFADCKMGLYADWTTLSSIQGAYLRPAIGLAFGRVAASVAVTCLEDGAPTFNNGQLVKYTSPDISFTIEYLF